MKLVNLDHQEYGECLRVLGSTKEHAELLWSAVEYPGVTRSTSEYMAYSGVLWIAGSTSDCAEYVEHVEY